MNINDINWPSLLDRFPSTLHTDMCAHECSSVTPRTASEQLNYLAVGYSQRTTGVTVRHLIHQQLCHT